MNNKNPGNEKELYTLYVHTNMENKKVYVGITGKEATSRWQEGDGYKHNPELYEDIKKYGWANGFFHQIVRDNLTLEKAKEAEAFFVEMYDSTNPLKGYNRRPGGWGYGDIRKRENFGEKIKNLRKTKHVNQDELAEYLGVRRSTISNWEINRRTPSMDDLKRVAEFFNVSLDYFGSDIKNDNFDILSRVMEYFRNSDISNEGKTALFNNILTAYAHLVINQETKTT